MDHDQAIRDRLVKHMNGGEAFVPFQNAVEGITWNDAGKVTDNQPYTIWELVEHIRLAQHDILAFSRNPDYSEPTWPDDYWPSSKAPKDEREWHLSLDKVDQELQEMIALVQDPANDLMEPIPWGNGETLMREANLVAEHKAYHTGQIVLIRKLLGLGMNASL